MPVGGAAESSLLATRFDSSRSMRCDQRVLFQVRRDRRDRFPVACMVGPADSDHQVAYDLGSPEPAGDGEVERNGKPKSGIEITFVDRITEWQHLEVDSAATVELPVRRVRDRGQETGSLPVGVVSQESKLRQVGVGERREHGGEAIGHREINMIG